MRNNYKDGTVTGFRDMNYMGVYEYNDEDDDDIDIDLLFSALFLLPCIPLFLFNEIWNWKRFGLSYPEKNQVNKL